MNIETAFEIIRTRNTKKLLENIAEVDRVISEQPSGFLKDELDSEDFDWLFTNLVSITMEKATK